MGHKVYTKHCVKNMAALQQSGRNHIRRVIGVRAIFCQGGAVNHLPKKFSEFAQILTKQSKRNEGHTMH